MDEKIKKPNPRKDLVKQLRTQLENEFVVIDRPDHPFLLIQPDVIVGGKGLLTALFFPSAHELSSPQKLLARLILSRLGLPAHAKCVLMIDSKKSTAKIHNEAVSHFHETFEISHWADLYSFIKDNKSGSRVKPVPPDIHKQTFERYSIIMKGSSQWVEKDKTPFDAKKLLNEFENKKYQQTSSSQLPKRYEDSNTPKTLQIYEDKFTHPLLTEGRRVSSDIKPSTRKPRQPRVTWLQGEDIVVAVFNQQSKLDKLRDVISFGVNLNYKLNEGIPTTPKDLKINFVALDELPVNQIDPEKPFRAGAFAGWLLMRPTSANEVEETNRVISENLREVLQK